MSCDDCANRTTSWCRPIRAIRPRVTFRYSTLSKGMTWNRLKSTKHCRGCENARQSNLFPGDPRRFRWRWRANRPFWRALTRSVGSCSPITRRWQSCLIDYWVNTIRFGEGMPSWIIIDANPCFKIIWMSLIRRGRRCNVWWTSIGRVRGRIMWIMVGRSWKNRSCRGKMTRGRGKWMCEALSASMHHLHFQSECMEGHHAPGVATRNSLNDVDQ
mmetsp:Transcript_28565/g.61424  ORF Transcript_28565/g.61424 Transcript_28565/m.61424 type:complete len:215 (+) Transcript_28565:650-1294(+)